MGDLASVTVVLAALYDARESLARFARRLDPSLRPTGPTLVLFDHLTGTGAAVELTATRTDGRGLSWLVEVWLHDTGDGAPAVVKAEIDLDDLDGDDHCVLNDQRSAADAAGTAELVRRAVDVVTSEPTADLLTDGWQPPEWDEDAADP